MKFCLIFFCFVLQLAASTTHASQKHFLSFKEYQSLSTPTKIKYIKDIRLILLESQKHSGTNYAINTFKIFKSNFFYKSAWASSSPQCIYAGHLSQLHYNNGRYVCKRPEQKHCSDNELPCNPLLYGKDNTGNAFCTPAGGLATKKCERVGLKPEEIANSLTQEDWQEVDKLESYCENPLGFQKVICEVFYQQRLHALKANKVLPQEQHESDANNKTCSPYSDPNRSLNQAAPGILERTKTCAMNSLSLDDFKDCLRESADSFAGEFNVGKIFSSIKKMYGVLKKIDPKASSREITSFIVKFHTSPNFRLELISKFAKASFEATHALIDKTRAASKGMTCEAVKDMACGFAGKLAAEALTALIPGGFAVKRGANAIEAAARAAQLVPSLGKAVSKAAKPMMKDRGLSEKQQSYIENTLKNGGNSIEESITEAPVQPKDDASFHRSMKYGERISDTNLSKEQRDELKSKGWKRTEGGVWYYPKKY